MVLLLVVLAAGSAPAQPKVSVAEGLKWDFGTIYTGHSVKHTFTIKNDGTDTLAISNVGSTCGCTGALVSHDRIVPGATGALEVTFDPSRFKGKVEKTVSFESNDPLHKKVRIQFTADVERVVNVDPEYVYFRVPPDSEASQEVTIDNEIEKDLKILSVSSSSPYISAKMSSNTIEGQDDAKLVCTLRPMKHGIYRANIDIKTDNPRVPELNIRVIAYVSAGEPSRITIKE